MLWTFKPVVVIAFLAAFSLGHEQIRTGCNHSDRHDAQCETAVLQLVATRAVHEGTLNKTQIKGASIEQFNWNETKEDPRTHNILESHDYPFRLGIVEYDDQGQKWSDDQERAVKTFVDDEIRSGDVLIVTFIHGWKNNCTTCNGNLACFRETLALLSAVENDLARAFKTKPRRVVGIYIAWRGETMRIKYANAISAFGRKAAADRVGGRTSDVTTFLSWLNEKKVNANRTALATALRGRRTSGLGTSLVVVGHSFGADVLFGAIAGHLNAQLGASDADGLLHAEPFADLTVLVNPALEASLYHAFADRVGSAYAPRQAPLIVTVQATNDQVTHYVFPIERAIVSLGQSTASSAAYGASLAAVGHYSAYYTHDLGEPKIPVATELLLDREKREKQALFKQLTNRPEKTPCGCESFSASRDAHAAMLRSVRDALRTDMTGEVHIGDPLIGLASELKPMTTANVRSPLLVVRATPQVVDGHSGIYHGQFFDFLVNMVVRAQLVQHQYLRDALLQGASVE